MSNNHEPDWLNDVDQVIGDALRFKAKLCIGEDAYTSLKLMRNLSLAWETIGAGGAGAVAASSTAVATTFFAPAGFWATVTFATAATPIGWVAAAGICSAGTYYGLTKYFKSATDERVTVIPHFINTPLDTLALCLFDFFAPLAMKLAIVDDVISQEERAIIESYFIKSWGYDKDFVTQGLNFVEDNLDQYSIEDIAKALASFKKSNADCNYSAMTKEIIRFLIDISEADGVIDPREEQVISLVNDIFYTTGRSLFSKVTQDSFNTISDTGARSIDLLNKGVNTVNKEVTSAGKKILNAPSFLSSKFRK